MSGLACTCFDEGLEDGGGVAREGLGTHALCAGCAAQVLEATTAQVGPETRRGLG